MGLRVVRGATALDQHEYVLEMDLELANETDGKVLDALVEHLSRLEGVWAYHADGRFQIRYTPPVVIAIGKGGQMTRTEP